MAEDETSFLKNILNKNYGIVVSIEGDIDTLDDKISAWMDNIGIERDGSQGVWYIAGNEGVKYWSGYTETYYISSKYHDIKLGSQHGSNIVIVDNNDYKNPNVDVNVLIYDGVTDSVVDCIGIDVENGVSIVRN